ncbi:DUF3078 domain-containing protein [Xanthomarina sp. F2636L]|uniref:DUF3078 domain-containing protein n=1 Tax=Xanthomarina sp. F2636L TaxID=2996018 RepID=UPI00225E52E9|nr:DUF3078 domain-containing protein [Xanthomarina sp. F2636L]MCX7551096.1 DUF3078 domain-containing protein [Xanthomarina sp. F2636L]
MKKILLVLALVTYVNLINAQDTIKPTDSLEGWSSDGKITLLINQSAFSNWQPGGDNNAAANLSVNYNIDYVKGPWLWDNKILASYGLTINDDDGMRKTDDRLELNSILGRSMNKKYWSFSFYMNFRTQFSDGYDYNGDFVGENEDFPTSGFFKPAYWSFGPGFLWKKSKNLSVNIAPVTSKFTFITSEIYTINDDDSDNVYYESSNDIETYGVAPGKSLLYEFGMNIRGYYKFDIMKNISMENILSLYSNYLNKPKNMDLDYTMNIVMKINDVFSTNLTFQTVYDDDAFEGFQIREVFGLGLNVNF